MHWRFVGTIVSWSGIKEIGANVNLNPKWHVPLPYMGSPVPELEIGELKELYDKELVVHLTSGGIEAAIQAVEDICNLSGLENIRPSAEENININGTISLQNELKTVNLTYYLQDHILDELINSIEGFAAAQSPKYFFGNTLCNFLIGNRALHTEPDRKAEFLSGERTVLVTGLPSIQFVHGEEILEQPDFQSLLSEISENI